MFYPGFGINVDTFNMNFTYDKNTFGPEVEVRHLDDIRKSMLDSKADGPDKVYTIAMDVGDKLDFEDLNQRFLLFGVCTYAAGKIGKEPVRSQGHIHSISASCNSTTPEVYEVWQGKCTVLLQETANDNPGRVYAVTAKKGEVIVVPPGWAHCTVNADPRMPMTFGAWCIRDYGFEYANVRKHHGLAFYPIVNKNNNISWQHNNCYKKTKITVKNPSDYSNLGINLKKTIYEQYQDNHNAFEFVTNPQKYQDVWYNFVP
ncbi:glucose-6-phosphate isomerase family protein [Pediococcus parvulus]